MLSTPLLLALPSAAVASARWLRSSPAARRRRKGLRNRALSRGDKWLRSHGVLPPELELPSQSLTSAGPIIELVAVGRFVVLSSRRYRKKPHINVGELSASLEAKSHHGTAEPSSRCLLFGDSQIATCAMLKGRSSSPSLNSLLERSLPTLLGNDTYSLPSWAPSASNPADDPTRDRPLREPSREPRWWADVDAGNFVEFDNTFGH